VQRVKTFRGALVTAVFASLLLLWSPAPSGADPSRDARELRAENETLAAQSHSTVLELYALERRLSAARQRVEALQSQVDAVTREQASVRYRLKLVRRLLVVSERNLGRRLIDIYEQGEPDTLAVVLGAESLRDAITDLDHLNAFAGQDQNMIAQARRGRLSLGKLTRALAMREERLEGLEREAAGAAGALDAARAERVGYLAELANERRLNEREISSLESRAQAAEERSTEIVQQQAVAPAAPPAPTTPAAPPVPANGSGRALTVVATAYSGGGSTATGLPTGPGIVAVDPTVIPFGTHMTIPGYGEGVAADTGSAIIGNRIDVWVPTEGEAEQWGVQTITIYLHG
jgi:3D (Asp-Asp-Asp) domain-containing protein